MSRERKSVPPPFRGWWTVVSIVLVCRLFLIFKSMGAFQVMGLDSSDVRFRLDWHGMRDVTKDLIYAVASM